MFFKKKCLILLVVLCFLLSAITVSAQSLPTLVDVNPSGNEGDWLVGATPPGGGNSKPVVVFVQGLNGQAENWWGPTKYYGNNDMYNYAYNAGYRAAFVNFRDADGVTGSMWRNGQTLKNQLQAICSYFGVSKVNLVCHSKGGVDAQSAIVHYGANLYVDKMVTLSSPHWGSQSADLAYSWFAGWLAELLGQLGDGTYVLQTSYMSYFRSITDNRSENDSISYYTFAGTNWGPALSALWFGASYLSIYGVNDGLVTVANSHNPCATHVATLDLNHDSIRKGSQVWSYVEPLISTYTTDNMSLSTNTTSALNAAADIPYDNPSGNTLIRGGEISGKTTVRVPVDSSAASVEFDLMVCDPSINAKLISPDGKQYSFRFSDKDQDIFNGASHFTVSVKKPKPGHWQLTLESSKKSAYLLVTKYASPLNASLKTNKDWTRKGDPVGFTVAFDHKELLKNHSTNVILSKAAAGKNGKAEKVLSFTARNGIGIDEGSMVMPDEPGLYTLNASVKGTLADGSPYERTVIKSILVEKYTDGSTASKIRNLKELLGE